MSACQVNIVKAFIRLTLRLEVKPMICMRKVQTSVSVFITGEDLKQHSEQHLVSFNSLLVGENGEHKFH